MSGKGGPTETFGRPIFSVYTNINKSRDLLILLNPAFFD